LPDVTQGEPPPPRVGSGVHRIRALELFLTFSHITLYSFGGALFWSRRMFVENKRWLTEQEFVEMLSISQVLPGANGVNMAVMIGYRLAGFVGAAASLAGFIAVPCAIVVGLALLYRYFGGVPIVRDALSGMAIVAVGLIIAMAAKIATVLRRNPLAWAFTLAAFIGIGVMRWPLLAVLGALAPFAIAAAWKGRL
jgi:chromate transporter